MKKFLFGGTGCTTKVGDIALMVMRVFVGLAFAIAHGLPKVAEPSKAIGAARSLNFPMPEAFGWSAILAEFLGGILLALGLLTRPSAFMLGATMVVAAFMIHGPHAFQKKELALTYLCITGLFLVIGGGRYSIDQLIRGGSGGSKS